ncbi:BrnT family toxin [Actimicrobium sp. CCI2.3]|uniref:BrnT family toxin n=1 Tax=Actimicrobium sp. CCI2.3 TaxID=3048616 RepID=UPI002AB56CB9|nr:BrnT family toxin [Actimicrobium sp. CCI2.3]MDY7574455.1 BrnT family toxin [Actimicrobium sp. CCI2.3]MEB0022467.1 BrnT family toxin [Actimicrobium sp. CCI2.3]
MANEVSPDESVSYDPNKRLSNLQKHGIDFRECGRIFDDAMLSKEDKRHDYEAARIISLGVLGDLIVYFVWEDRHLPHCISCREAAKHEKAIYKKHRYR